MRALRPVAARGPGTPALLPDFVHRGLGCVILRCYLGQLCYSGQHKYNCAAATSRNVRRNKSQQAAYGAVSRLVAADVGCIAWDPSLLLLRSAITDIAANFLRSYCAPPRPPSADSHRAAGACCALCSCCALCACCASSRVERPIAAPRCLLRLIAAYCRARGATCSWYPPTTGRSRATYCGLLRLLIAAYCRARGATCSWYPPTTGRSRATTPAAPAPRPSSPSAPTPRSRRRRPVAVIAACCGRCGLLRLVAPRPSSPSAPTPRSRPRRPVAVIAARCGHCGALRLVAPRPSSQSAPTPRRAPAPACCGHCGLLRSLRGVPVIAGSCGLSRRARLHNRCPRRGARPLITAACCGHCWLFRSLRSFAACRAAPVLAIGPPARAPVQ